MAEKGVLDAGAGEGDVDARSGEDDVLVRDLVVGDDGVWRRDVEDGGGDVGEVEAQAWGDVVGGEGVTAVDATGGGGDDDKREEEQDEELHFGNPKSEP